jgi:Baseplate J-like protein
MTPDICGCCELPPSTPLAVFNRPGLSAIAFRTGTYATFRQSMLQRIARTPALSALRTRADDDYAITVLDLWATIADILTFYQERIANEGFLRTARLRDSILRMARLLDYQLRPGVAATTVLAFTLDRDAALRIPIGLRVQSVPADEERPQIFETLESIQATAALNRVRIVPAPEGFNPLERGAVSAVLAPGPGSLAAAAAIAPGNRILLFASGSGEREELTVRALQTDEDGIRLNWSGPIQSASWDVTASAYAVGRTFRVFGHNAPTQYMEVREIPPPPPGQFIWALRTFTSYTYTPADNVLELDARYEGIAAGSRLVIAQPESSTVATVTAVGQGQATFLAPGAATSPVQDTVTRLTLDAAPLIADRRATLIYEVKSPRIRFWGYRYPDIVGGSTLYVPARRIGARTAEIGQSVQGNRLNPGIAVPLDTIEPGRRVMLRDRESSPAAAVVSGATAVGLDVTIDTTADDLTTARELGLAADTARRTIALQSAARPGALDLTSAAPELSVAIGGPPTRRIALATIPTTVEAAAVSMQAALVASLPAVPEFAQSRVLRVDDTLLVLPGVPGAPIAMAATAADQTTAGELGLVGHEALTVDALLSADLSSFPVVSSPSPQISVTFGPIGPRTVALGSTPAGLASARRLLEAAIRAADGAPAFRHARVVIAGSQLLVLPGTAGQSFQEYVALTVKAESPPLQLATASSVLLGNVARASHGESVRDEVLGDGDAARPFQKFELARKPLTYTPSAGPGGVDSTLTVLVNDVRWTEVPTLFGRGAAEQIYTTRLADDGTVTVGFGDGRTGARLPSGRGNVVADYRQGSGLVGRVAARSLRSPLDLPVGLRSVENPIPATGGADPEALDQARENAPTTVRTFGRAVSLRDFEDLVRSTGEVAKALATWVWNGETRAVHLTVAAQEGQLLTDADLRRIHASLDASRDPNHTLFLANFVPVPIALTATLRVEPTHVSPKVAAAARAAILRALSFESLRFAQPVVLSEVYRVLHETPGVRSVDIDRLHFKDPTPAFLAARGATSDPVQRSLRIFAARPGPVPPAVLPAELAVVQTPPADVVLTTSGGLPE